MKPTTTLTIKRPEVPADRLEIPTMSTNGAATWSLDAIYMLEVIPDVDETAVSNFKPARKKSNTNHK